MKVKSSVIRQVMRRLEFADISMPDDAREIVFPSAVPVQMLPEKSEIADDHIDAIQHLEQRHQREDDSVANRAEGDFASEASEIQQQADASRDPDEAETDLLGDGETNRSKSELAKA